MKPIEKPLLDAVGGQATPRSIERRLYAGRWVVLALYSALAFAQGGVWSLFSPVSGKVQDVYGIDSNGISLIANWGPITYMVSSIPWAYLLDKNLRWSQLVGMGLVVASAALRLLVTGNNVQSRLLIHASAILNGLAGPAAMSICSKLSEVWFGPKERTTATALGSCANMLGVAVSFLDPYILHTASNDCFLRLFWGLFASITAVGVASVIYFPDKPPTPPSVSATGGAERDEALSLKSLWASTLVLVKAKHFMVLAVCYGMVTGIYAGWSGVLDLNLRTVGLNETKAGWIGFLATATGCLGSVVLGYFADRFHNLKAFIVTLLALASIAFVYFATAVTFRKHEHDLPHDLVAIFVSTSLGGFFVNCLAPFFFECAVESSHPSPEGTTVVVLTTLNNLAACIFLAVPTRKYGVAWMNWAMAGTLVVSVVLMNGFKGDDSRRLKLDRHLDGEEGDDDVEGHHSLKQYGSEGTSSGGGGGGGGGGSGPHPAVTQPLVVGTPPKYGVVSSVNHAEM